MPAKHRQFGAFIAKRRAALGLSVLSVVAETGITRSNYYRYESGEVLPKADKLQRLARALDVSYEDLLAAAGAAPPDGLPTLAPYLRAKYRDLPDEALNEAEQFFAELQARYAEGGGNAESNH